MRHAGWCPEWCEGRIVNIRETDKYDVFIGRGSKWGNPFPIADGCSREQVIKMSEANLRRRPDLIVALPELAWIPIDPESPNAWRPNGHISRRIRQWALPEWFSDRRPSHDVRYSRPHVFLGFFATVGSFDTVGI